MPLVSCSVKQRGNIFGSVLEVSKLLIESSAWQLITARRKGEKAIIRDGLVMMLVEPVL